MAMNWNGAALVAKVRRAQIAGVNKTMAQAVIHAKQNHDWQNRTGILEGSIQIAEFAHGDSKGVSGRWGSKDVVYAAAHEFGSAKQNIPPRPYLRPAADATYGNLAANIREGLK